jgi:hypothetical protein
MDGWESARHQRPTQRALTLLSRLCPGSPLEELASLPLGQRHRLLLEGRAAALGGTLDALVNCPECDAAVSVSLAVADVTGRDAEACPVTDLEWGDFHLRFRLPDSHDCIAIGECASREQARSTLLLRCTLEARRGDQAVDTAALPEEMVAALESRMVECDPLAEILLALDCPECAAQWRAELNVADFVWEEWNASARRLLCEIDALARVYGWSEAEILKLSPARRAWYVERVAA